MRVSHLYKQTLGLAYHLLLIALIMVVLVPVFYVISMSFSLSSQASTSLIPSDFTWNNWKYVLGLSYQDVSTGELTKAGFPMLLWLFNSVKISLITSVLVLMISTTGAYALSRFRFRGRKSSLMSLMIVQLFPNMMAIVSLYLMLDFVGNYFPAFGTDTHGGLILVYLGGTPFHIWLIKGYFDTIPLSMEESAIIDGCTWWQAFYRILLPLSSPILAVVGLLTFITTFADFILPSVLLKSTDKMTFAVGIQIFVSNLFASKWGQFAAASMLGAVPVAVLFFSIHRYIISGLSAGGVKH